MSQHEGVLYIQVARMPDTYQVTFAPYGSGGGPLPSRFCNNVDELRTLLTTIGIRPGLIEQALREVGQDKVAEIEHVTFTDAHYGL